MSWIQTIFLNIAKRLGLELQRKPAELDDYSKPGLSMTAVIANRVATLTLQDSVIDIVGNNARAKFIEEFMQQFQGWKMGVSAEVGLGTGDCLVKPYTDGKRIGVDIIKNGDFVVCESIEDYIKSCIIKVGEIVTDNGTKYERFETQIVRDGMTEDGQSVSYLIIQNSAYKNGTQVPLDSVPAWADIKPGEIIPNVTAPLFGRFKCPTVNRGNVNGANGVKITHGLDDVMKKAVEAYERFNEEYKVKEPFIFADKTVFTKDTTGKLEIPKGKERVFQIVRGSQDANGQKLIQEYSPDIRSADLDTGIQVNFKMLELMAGLSAGILTSPTTNFATATEMRASLQATFAFITRFRRQIEVGTRQLLQAVDVIANRNNLAPIGDWDIAFNWSASYIEQMAEHFNQLMMAQGVGAVSAPELRAWLLDEDLETAKQRVEEIAKETGADMMREAGLNEPTSQGIMG